MSAIALASGGALVAVAGTLVSTFLTFNPSIGIEFTMKALVVAVMGGVGKHGRLSHGRDLARGC
jgi:branched-chain amino acid transport system permease protein